MTPDDRLLVFLDAFRQLHGVNPSFREMMVPLRTVSTNHVAEVVERLRYRELVTTGRNGEPRAVALTDAGRERLDALLPTVVVGYPSSLPEPTT